MNKVQKLTTGIATLGTTILSSLLLPFGVFAQVNNDFSINCTSLKQGGINAPCVANISDILSKAVIIIFIVAALLAFIFLIIGGIRWIVSGGNKEGTTAARGMITAAIVGLAIVFLSFVVINVLGTIFGFSIFNLKIPSLAI